MNRRTLLSLALTSITLAACDSNPADPGVVTAPAASLSASNGYADEAPTYDAVLNAVSLRHPGFKGVVGTADGRRSVVVDPLALLDAPALLADLATTLQTDPAALVLSSLPALTTGRADFHELYAVKTGLRRFMFEDDLVTYLDLDEVAGRVVVGTADAAAQARVQGQMTAAERQASDFVTKAVAEPLAAAPLRALRGDAFRPLVSGAKAAITNSSYCTQGPAVRYNGGAYGFLTNAHCTGDYNTVSGTPFYQPFVSATSRIGTETAEPAYRSGWFITDGYYADAAFVRTPNDLELTGTVTSSDNCNNGGPCTENGIINQVVGTSSYLPVNIRVFKTGATTGSTAGLIAETCVDVSLANPAGGTVKILCSTSVSYAAGIATTLPLADPGDSGSPVLTNGGTPGSNATTLGGVLFAKNRGSSTQFYFSPWENIWNRERTNSYGLDVEVVVASRGVVANRSSGGPGGPGDPGGPGGPGDGPDGPRECSYNQIDC